MHYHAARLLTYIYVKGPLEFELLHIGLCAERDRRNYTVIGTYRCRPRQAPSSRIRRRLQNIYMYICT